MKKKEVKEVTKRNVAIEIWRFLIAFAVIGFHTGFIIARGCTGAEGNGYFMEVTNTWFFGSSEVLLIFTLTAGYFLVKHFKKRNADPEYAKRSAASRAWEYTWTRVKALIPVLILGYILGVLISTRFYYPDYGFKDYAVMLVNSVWEFLGFHAAGLRSAGGQFFNTNGVLWFISAIIIMGYFIYWGLAKNEDFFAGVLAPFTFIFLGGWWCFTGTRAAQTAWSTLGTQTASTNGMGGSATAATGTFGMNNGTIYVLLGLMGGILIYYLVEKLKEHKFTAGGKLLLTVFNVICSALLLWYVIYNPTYFELDRWTVHFLCIAVVTMTLLNKDLLTGLLNNAYTEKLFAFLGSISLYVYMLHYPVAVGILRLYGKNTAETIYTFWQIFIPTAIITIILAILTKLVMDETILKKK